MTGIEYFFLSLVLLLLGYLVYGRVVERIFGIDRLRPTPLASKEDGVDYVRLPSWKIFLIQLLNIAGLGPVLGPILGALYGPAALLWVVFGCIFAGAVHDFCTAMMSLRYGGASYPEVIGRNLGKPVRRVMELLTILLLVLVGVVFVQGPARLLASTCGLPVIFWVSLIFIYYFIATVLPIDTIIGRIYPFFAVLLLFMAIGLLGALFWQDYTVLPSVDLWTNTHPKELPRWPLLFITVACGAISGFHATQSPLMTRCMTSETQGRPFFYGAMIAEGVIGLIWVTLGLSFYPQADALQAVITQGSPTLVVKEISMTLLGPLGGLLAVLGVVVLPVSTGDTAFRSSRLIVADLLHLQQKHPVKRLCVAVPLFAIGIALCFVDFDIIWRYFGWANQTMAAIALWASAVYLARRGRFHWICSLPAAFMTAVCTTYICYDKIGFHLPLWVATTAGIVLAAGLFWLFWKRGAVMPAGDEADC